MKRSGTHTPYTIYTVISTKIQHTYCAFTPKLEILIALMGVWLFSNRKHLVLVQTHTLIDTTGICRRVSACEVQEGI